MFEITFIKFNVLHIIIDDNDADYNLRSKIYKRNGLLHV